MADILPVSFFRVDGQMLEVVDLTARQAATAKTSFKGILAAPTATLDDGATTNPVYVKDGSSSTKTVSVIAGDIVVDANKKEFIFDGEKWQLMGYETQGLGELAYKNNASGTYVPAGSVSQPSFTQTSGNVTITTEDDANGNYIPKGSISGITWSGSQMTSSATYTPEGSVSLSNVNRSAAVSKAESGEATYTPEGTISAPTISLQTAGSSESVKTVGNVNNVVSAVNAANTVENAIGYTSYDSTTATLTLYPIGYSTSKAITTVDKTVKTGDAAYSASAPTFSGTGARLVTDNISVPNSASFSGTEVTIESTGTTTGAITSQGIFTGTKTKISGEAAINGEVSKPTFSGTQATITVQ